MWILVVDMCQFQFFQQWCCDVANGRTWAECEGAYLHLRGAPGIEKDGFHFADVSDVPVKTWAALTHEHTQSVGGPFWIWARYNYGYKVKGQVTFFK